MLTRRSLVIKAGVAAAAIAGGGRLAAELLEPADRFDRARFPEPRGAAAAVVRASGYDDRLEELVIDGLRAIGADVRRKSVLLKPNLVEFNEGPVNTDPRLVAATVVAMRRLGARSVVVGEGPGHRRDVEAVVVASGLFDALEEVGASFVDLNSAPVVRRPLQTRYTSLRELWLPRPLVEADVVVSMPKLKTHHWVGVTLSLKNLFGCLPGRVYGWPKNVLHWQGIAESILDIAATVRPSLAIVDGIVGMEGDGPILGTPKQAGVLVFAGDPVAADATAARVMGIDGEKVTYLKEAGRFLGQVHLERIEQRGEDLERSAVEFAVTEPFRSLKL